MPSSDKTRKNLMASMMKSKTGTTQEKAPAKTVSTSAKPAAASKPSASSKKPRPAKKKAVKRSPAAKKQDQGERRLPAADTYQSNGRIWPD